LTRGGPSRFRRQPEARALVLGHRGARHAAPENTFAAFELARTEGADGIELDVRLDAEGNVIVLHDPALTRVTGGASTERAQDVPLARLLTLDVGGGERVPLLRDVLHWVREQDACVNVELKSDLRDRAGLVRRVAELLAREPELSERVLLSSFHPGMVLALARALPGFDVNWLVHAKQRVFRGAPAWHCLGAAGVNPEHTLLSLGRVRAWRRQGALLGTWTVNDPQLAAAYAAFGVDAVISDCPGKVLAAVGKARAE